MVTREFFRRWGEYRQLLRELKSYSDVELAELGMVRTACARTAFDAAFGSPLDDLRRVVEEYRWPCSTPENRTSRTSSPSGPYFAHRVRSGP